MLGAAIAAADKRGVKVTGHLCSIGFREAAALGIDDLEHGLTVDTEFFSRKKPDQCPDYEEVVRELVKRIFTDAPIQVSSLITSLSLPLYLSLSSSWGAKRRCNNGSWTPCQQMRKAIIFKHVSDLIFPGMILKRALSLIGLIMLYSIWS